MRVTVCELPHESHLLETAWSTLCRHTRTEHSELVVLPEFAFVAPLWESERFDTDRWSAAVATVENWMARFPKLGASWVIGSRPVTIDGKPYNQGFLWSADNGVMPLRSKYFLPEEPGGWEARWFERGDEAFPAYSAGSLSFGLSICTELWSLETYGRYASLGIHAIVSPRATAAATTNKWLSLGTVAAARAGAYSLSSNRIHTNGSCGGVGWIISPDGELLCKTSASEPFCTYDIEPCVSEEAKSTYPRYVFDDAA